MNASALVCVFLPNSKLENFCKLSRTSLLKNPPPRSADPPIPLKLLIAFEKSVNAAALFLALAALIGKLVKSTNLSTGVLANQPAIASLIAPPTPGDELLIAAMPVAKSANALAFSPAFGPSVIPENCLN